MNWYRQWHRGLLTGALIVASVGFSLALDRDYPHIPGYAPGTPPWIPLIDACMTAGGGRIDCIEALPPDMYEAFLADEQARAARRRALMQLSRTPPQVPATADLPHIYQSPLALEVLPADIARDLAAAGCLVPRSSGGESNVVIGQLAAAGQHDVAVICSVDGVSEIRIYWGGDARCPALDATSPDWALLHETERWEYHWSIAISAPEHIRSYYDRHPDSCPTGDLPVMIHDGIEHIFIEKGSSNLYCHEGQWLRLCGAD